MPTLHKPTAGQATGVMPAPYALTSPNGLYTMAAQQDGNLVLYYGNSAMGAAAPYWSSGSNGKGSPPYNLVMQQVSPCRPEEASSRPAFLLQPACLPHRLFVTSACLPAAPPTDVIPLPVCLPHGLPPPLPLPLLV